MNPNRLNPQRPANGLMPGGRTPHGFYNVHRLGAFPVGGFEEPPGHHGRGRDGKLILTVHA